MVGKNMNIEKMQDILNKLSATEGVRLYQEPNMAGMMYVEFGYVEGPTIEHCEEQSNGHYPNAESRYLVCLHEIGHFHWGHTQGRPWNEEYENKAPGGRLRWENFWDLPQAYFDNGVLKSEAQAWNYALDNCGIPSEDILPETRAFMWDVCLGSYFNHARSVGFGNPGQMLYNGDRHHVKFAYGKPDGYFFQTKRRIIEGDLGEEMPNRKRPKPSYPNYLDWTSTSNNTTITYNTITYNTGTGY
jgi:hypothetical protein